MGMILNLLFFLMTLTGAWGFWKHRALRLSNMYLDSVTGGMNESLFQERFEEELHQMEGILGFLYVNIKKFVTIQYPVKGTLIFGQNRENKDSASSSF